MQRVRRNLTQEQLAELVEVSTKHVTKIENSKSTPSSYLLFKFSKALKVSMDKLVEKDVD
ncbi:helix-turn-helix transcriptional regulator [bacterium]|nr:helix-turn-helix transcriptional regulator [bacterium]